jgi:hypothetical protein
MTNGKFEDRSAELEVRDTAKFRVTAIILVLRVKSDMFTSGELMIIIRVENLKENI